MKEILLKLSEVILFETPWFKKRVDTLGSPSGYHQGLFLCSQQSLERCLEFRDVSVLEMHTWSHCALCFQGAHPPVRELDREFKKTGKTSSEVDACPDVLEDLGRPQLKGSRGKARGFHSLSSAAILWLLYHCWLVGIHVTLPQD